MGRRPWKASYAATSQWLAEARWRPGTDPPWAPDLQREHRPRRLSLGLYPPEQSDNKFLLFLSHSVWGALLQQCQQMNTLSKQVRLNTCIWGANSLREKHRTMVKHMNYEWGERGSGNRECTVIWEKLNGGRHTAEHGVGGTALGGGGQSSEPLVQGNCAWASPSTGTTLLGLSEKVGGYDLARLGRAKRPVKKPLHSLRRQVMNKGCE